MKSVSGLIALVVFLAACATPATLVATPTATTFPPTVVPTATMTAVPTPFALVEGGTPLPASALSIITPQNADKLRQVALYGEKKIVHVLQAGKLLLVEHPGGAELLDVSTHAVLSTWQFDQLLGYMADGTSVLASKANNYVVLTGTGHEFTWQKPGGFSQSAALSPDGKFVAIADGQSVKIFSLPDQTSVASLPNQFAFNGGALLFSPGGKYLVGVGPGIITLIRTSDWKVYSAVRLSSSKYSYAFSSDDATLATLISDKIEIWETTETTTTNVPSSIFTSGSQVTTLKKLRTITGQFVVPEADMSCPFTLCYESLLKYPVLLQFSPDDQKLAAIVTPGKKLTVWSVSDLSVLNSVTTDAQSMVNVNVDNEGKIQDSRQLESPTLWVFPMTSTSGFAFSADGSEIRTTTIGSNYPETEEVCTFSLEKAPECQSSPVNRDTAKYQEVLLASNGDYYSVAKSGSDYVIQQGRGEAGNIAWKISGVPATGFTPLFFGPAQPLIIFYNLPRQVFSGKPVVPTARNLSSQQDVESSLMPSVVPDFMAALQGLPAIVLKLAGSREGERVAMLDAAGKIILINGATLQVEKTIAPLPVNGAYAKLENVLAVSSDGKQLAYVESLPSSGGNAATIYKLVVMGLEGSEQPHSYDLQFGQSKNTEGFDAMAYSPDGSMIAISTYDANIYLIDSQTGSLLNTLKAATPALRLAFSPDGKLLATEHGVDGIHVWGLQ